MLNNNNYGVENNNNDNVDDIFMPKLKHPMASLHTHARTHARARARIHTLAHTHILSQTRAHMRSIPSRLRGFLKVAFEMVPMFV